MHPTIVSHIVSPLLERMLGRKTFANLKELETTQWWPHDQIREMQVHKLGRLLSIVQANCPYYSSLFADLGLNLKEDDPFSLLPRLPLLGKTQIRANLEAMTNHNTPGGPIQFNTGGSTGEPLVFYSDRRRIGYDKAARLLTHNWFNAAPGEREVYLWGSPVEIRAQDHLKRIRDHITNEILLEAFNLSPESMQRYLARIHSFDPVSIFGYPSSLAKFAEYCESEGKRFEGRNLKVVFVTGESLVAGQKETLQRFFKVRVANCYGSRDGGFIAHECPHGQMHLFDQNIIAEIVDLNGQPVSCGQDGEIVITHLDAWATPLLRYRTGDRGRLLSTRCECGRGMQLLGEISGRQTDHLLATNGSMQHALSVIYVIRELKTVRQYQVHQYANLNIDVLIVPEHGFGIDDRQHIEKGIKKQLGSTIDVKVAMVDSISVEKSGKFRHVISEAINPYSKKTHVSDRKEDAA